MDSRFEDAFSDRFTNPDFETFKIVFYPDRIYHAAYLNATRSARYRYNVQEVRNALDITILKGQVYMDGVFLCNFVRIEYRASRLVELARVGNRFLGDYIIGWVRLRPTNLPPQEAQLKLCYDRWVDAYQVEIWETLEAPLGKKHDFMVLDLMGRNGSIVKVKQFGDALRDVKNIKQLEVAFRENDTDLPFGYMIGDPKWDNDFLRTHQQPSTQEPSSYQNTVDDQNYLIDFQRGWFLQSNDFAPVRYRNAMMTSDNPEVRDDNIIEMRWVIQRELGSSVVFFHQVTIPPGTIEGTHRHIGTEELYYIVEGKGTAYMGDGDDPNNNKYPLVDREIYTLGKGKCRELPVESGNVIYTKSGGIHGIRNNGTVPLKFVAFLYHTS